MQMKSYDSPLASGIFCGKEEVGTLTWFCPWLLNTVWIHPMSRSELLTESYIHLALKWCRLAIFSCSQTTHSTSIFSTWWTSHCTRMMSRTKDASWSSADLDAGDFDYCFVRLFHIDKAVYLHCVSRLVSSHNMPYKPFWEMCGLLLLKLDIPLSNKSPVILLSGKGEFLKLRSELCGMNEHIVGMDGW